MFAASHCVAVTNDVEENFYDAEREKSAEQTRQNQEQQINEMAAVGADERPGAYRETEDVARAERARLRKRDFAWCRRRYDGCRFSDQLIT